MIERIGADIQFLGSLGKELEESGAEPSCLIRVLYFILETSAFSFPPSDNQLLSGERKSWKRSDEIQTARLGYQPRGE